MALFQAPTGAGCFGPGLERCKYVASPLHTKLPYLTSYRYCLPDSFSLMAGQGPAQTIGPCYRAKASNRCLLGQEDMTHHTHRPQEVVSEQSIRFNEHMMNQLSVVMEAAGLVMCGQQSIGTHASAYLIGHVPSTFSP